MIDLDDFDQCSCYYKKRTREGRMVLYHCQKSAAVRAHMHSEEGIFYLVPACHHCNRQHGATMYVKEEYMYPLTCPKACSFREEQSRARDTFVSRRDMSDERDYSDGDDSDGSASSTIDIFKGLLTR